jgi:pyruvate/2-oxoglutarate dehydrogenase complex dihydrolipoamide acyltransferase (E2) component
MTAQLASTSLLADFDPAKSAHRSAGIGLICAAAFIALSIAAAKWINIAGAVVTQGLLVVDSNVKKIQHPTDGVVGQLFVRDGSRVKVGDILVRLDDTQTRANLGIITKQLDELGAKQAREEAERDNLDAIEYPKDLDQRRSDPDVEHILTGETRLFGIREAARAGQKSQLQDEITGLEVQQEARVSQITWIKKELEGVNSLWKQNLVPYARVTSLEREASRLEGERGQLISVVLLRRRRRQADPGETACLGRPTERRPRLPRRPGQRRPGQGRCPRAEPWRPAAADGLAKARHHGPGRHRPHRRKTPRDLHRSKPVEPLHANAGGAEGAGEVSEDVRLAARARQRAEAVSPRRKDRTRCRGHQAGV